MASTEHSKTPKEPSQRFLKHPPELPKTIPEQGRQARKNKLLSQREKHSTTKNLTKKKRRKNKYHRFKSSRKSGAMMVGEETLHRLARPCWPHCWHIRVFICPAAAYIECTCDAHRPRRDHTMAHSVVATQWPLYFSMVFAYMTESKDISSLFLLKGCRSHCSHCAKTM